MCIAILNKVGTLPKEYIQNSWDNNYHGAGLAFSDGTRIVTYKTDTNADNFYKKYKKYRKQYPDVPFLLHFRISTHGTISVDNLHPFVINDNVALIHNGMVDLTDHSKTDHRSDTRYLCEEILANMPDGWHRSSGVHKLIGEVGGWSKFVLLDIDHNYSIIGEDAGHWADDNWYSNNSYKQVNRYVDYGGKKVDKGSTGSGGYFGNSYGGSYGSNYGSSYGSTQTAYVSLDKTKTMEYSLRQSGVIDLDESIFSTHISKELVDDMINIDAVHGDASNTNLDTWYHVSYGNGHRSDHELYVLELDGKKYTLVRNTADKLADVLYVLPFPVRMDEIVETLLTELDARSKSYSTMSSKIEAIVEEFKQVAIEAEDILLDGHWTNAYDEYADVCDSCLTKKGNLRKADGSSAWMVCNDCSPMFAS